MRARGKGVEFFQGWADDVNFNEKRLRVESATLLSSPQPAGQGGTYVRDAAKPKSKGLLFDLSYDKLVVAVGCYSQTFGTPGVRENALFLKDVVDARKIRKRILEC